jgi:hypothetical protein
VWATRVTRSRLGQHHPGDRPDERALTGLCSLQSRGTRASTPDCAPAARAVIIRSASAGRIRSPPMAHGCAARLWLCLRALTRNSGIALRCWRRPRPVTRARQMSPLRLCCGMPCAREAAWFNWIIGGADLRSDEGATQRVVLQWCRRYRRGRLRMLQLEDLGLTSGSVVAGDIRLRRRRRLAAVRVDRSWRQRRPSCTGSALLGGLTLCRSDVLVLAWSAESVASHAACRFAVETTSALLRIRACPAVWASRRKASHRLAGAVVVLECACCIWQRVASPAHRFWCSRGPYCRRLRG